MPKSAMITHTFPRNIPPKLTPGGYIGGKRNLSKRIT